MYSSNLNHIESIWNVLGQPVSTRVLIPASLKELKTVLMEEWLLLASALVDHIGESMDNLYKNCVKVRGGQLPY